MLIYSSATLAGFVLLVAGADRFVTGAGATARNLGVSPLLIGLTIVGFATSAPEVFVSIVASLQGTPSLAIGNAIGSNTANIGLVLGATALITPIYIRSQTLRREIPALLAVTLLTSMMMQDDYLSRFDGLILIAALGLLFLWIARLGFRSTPGDPIQAEFAAEIPTDLSMFAALFWLALGLLILLSGSHLLVWGAGELAKALGVSDLIIGLTVVAVGTSLPELAVSIVSALKKEHGLAIGNIIGSNMFNLLAVVGVAAMISPTDLSQSVMSLHYPVMVGFTLVLFAIAYSIDGQSRVNRPEGLALLVAFFAYHSYVLLAAS